MKVVLDTNVLVSGLLNPFGAPGKIVVMVSTGDLSLCYDARIISEYREVLKRPKFSFNQTLMNYLLDQISSCGVLVAASPLADDLPDPDDNPFLEVAWAGEARCLVTGNLKHYPNKLRHGVVVVSPNELLEIYRKQRYK